MHVFGYFLIAMIVHFALVFRALKEPVDPVPTLKYHPSF